MNLIEELGIEKARAIVDGAPETATIFCRDKYYEEWSHTGWVVSDGRQWVDCEKPRGCLIGIADLRTAIMNHGTPTNEGTRNTDITDNCTDIRNHISPNTKVIER